MTQDIVEQWTELSRRDDLFNHMVPSDVRMMLGEISRARAERDEYIRQCKEALHDAAEAKGDAHKHWVDKVNAEAERDEASAKCSCLVLMLPNKKEIVESLPTRSRVMLEVVEAAGQLDWDWVCKVLNNLSWMEYNAEFLAKMQAAAGQTYQALAKLNARGE